MSTLSTHILDISTGTPAEGVTVSLSREGRDAGEPGDQRPGGVSPPLAPRAAAGGALLLNSGNRGVSLPAPGARASLPGRRLILLSARRQRTISICRFSSPRAGWSTYRGS